MGLFRQIARVLLVLLVLVSFAAVQSASAMEIQADHHGADDRREHAVDVLADELRRRGWTVGEP